MTNYLPKLLVAALTVMTLAAGSGVAVAGELALLHRAQIAGTPGTPPSAAPEAPGNSGSTAAPPGIMSLQPLPARVPLPPIERIGYEALRCRGFCPVFTVIFSADGTFSYVGESNVEMLGEHTGSVDGFTLEQIMRYVEAIDFMDLANSYPSHYADVQTTYTMVDWNGDTKVIENQGGSAPVTVWALERLLLDLLDTASWD